MEQRCLHIVIPAKGEGDWKSIVDIAVVAWGEVGAGKEPDAKVHVELGHG